MLQILRYKATTQIELSDFIPTMNTEYETFNWPKRNIDPDS